MGILDNLKNQVEKLGDKAKEGLDDVKDRAGDLLDDAKDKAGDLLDDAKERLGHDDETSPLTESSDVGPDSSSTDAVQPGYVTAEDDVTEDSDETSLEAETVVEEDVEGDVDDVDDLNDVDDDVVPPAAAGLDPVEIDAEETDADAASIGTDTDEPVVEPLVEKDVDPYDEPLTESIGDGLAGGPLDREALADAVDPERDASA